MKHNEIEHLLPVVFRRTLRSQNPLSGLLDVMSALHQPSEDVLAQVDTTFSPFRTPDRFVPFLASWVDLDRFFAEGPARARESSWPRRPISTGLGRLRELIAAAAHLSQWRGTPTGLRRFLETATGTTGFELNEQVAGADGSQRPYHFQVRAPQSLVRHQALIERIIEQEKPAYVTYELQFGPADRGGEK